jgi:hypothetical protein
MLKRLFDLKNYLTALVNSVPFGAYLKSQRTDVAARGNAAKSHINSEHSG